MGDLELPMLKRDVEESTIPITIIIGVIILFIMFVFTVISLTIKRTYTLPYTEYSDIDYKVYLKDNNFFTEEYLPKDKHYISSLISYVDADLKYDFIADDNIDIQYEYYVRGNLLIDNNSGKNIMTKEFELVPSTNINNFNSRKFSIDENLIIKYDDYNQIAKDFINEYGIHAKASLLVELYVKVSGSKNKYDESLTKNAVLSLRIPLVEDTSDIELDYNTVNNADAVLQYSSVFIKNKTLFVLCILFAVLDAISVILIVAYVVKYRSPETLYKIKLKRITTDYSKYITETAITERVDKLLETRSIRIVKVKTFEGLLDLRDTLGKQILYHEERPGQECIFYLFTENIGYVYVMNVKDFKNKNNSIKK